MAARASQSVLKVIGSAPPNSRVAQSVLKVIAVGVPLPIVPAGSPTPGAAPDTVRRRAPQACNAFLEWNQYDKCLLDETRRYSLIRFPDPWSCSIPEEYRSATPWDEDTIALPPQAEHLRKTHAITTPTTLSGDNPVVSVECPIGYDGLLTGIVFWYSGTGFVQGSGDIIYRVRINQYFPRDLGRVPFQFGTPAYPFQLEQGIVFQSGQVVTGIVNVPNLSGFIQIGASRILMGLFGFFWPRGLKQYFEPVQGMQSTLR